jgi:hypothetical protein
METGDCLRETSASNASHCCALPGSVKESSSSMPTSCAIILLDALYRASAYVSIRQHAAAYVSMRQHTSECVSIRQHAGAYVSMRQHTSAYASIRQHTPAYVSIRQHTPHTSAYVSIRQHTPAYGSIREVSRTCMTRAIALPDAC